MSAQAEPAAKRIGLRRLTGLILAVFGFTLLASGVIMIYLNTQTDAEGYSMSNTYALRTETQAYWMRISALKFESFYSKLGLQLFGVDQMAQTKWVVRTVDPSRELFIGLAPASEANAYLNLMQSETPYPSWEWNHSLYGANLNITSTQVYQGQEGLTRSPSEEPFWIGSRRFSDQGVLSWDPYWTGMENDKYLFIMNLDGSSGVQADIQFGFKIPLFAWLQYVLAALGLALVAVGFLLLRR